MTEYKNESKPCTEFASVWGLGIFSLFQEARVLVNDSSDRIPHHQQHPKAMQD